MKYVFDVEGLNWIARRARLGLLRLPALHRQPRGQGALADRQDHRRAAGRHHPAGRHHRRSTDRSRQEERHITIDEINEALPQDQISSEQIEDIMSAISEMGVNIVENDENRTTRKRRRARGGGRSPRRRRPPPAVATKKEAVDRTDDPVRMYLREMGAVELLSREGEIAIAKRIEAGRDTMIWGLCESPITFNAIIEWSNALNEGTHAAARDPRSRSDAVEGPDRRADQRERGRRQGDGEGEISERSPARPSRKRKRSPRSPRPAPTKTMRTWSSGAPSRPAEEEDEDNTLSPRPDGRDAEADGAREVRRASPRSTRNSPSSSMPGWTR